MRLKRLHIENFKNYTEKDLSFGSDLIGICGPNGCGKTNLLDAIHYLSLGKSYIHHVDQQNIRHGANYFLIEADLDTPGQEEVNLKIGYSPSRKKKISRNGVAYEKVLEHIGYVPVIMITPFDLSLITGTREERRRLMDKVISQFDKDYLYALVNYNKVLEQRNKLIKQSYGSSSLDPQLTSVYDEQLVRYGQVIFEGRKNFIEQLYPHFASFYGKIAGVEESVSMVYESQLQKTDFSQALKDALNDDIQFQRTTVGPHRDEVGFYIFERPLKKFGSQGQQKTFLFSLKLALNEVFLAHKGYPPLMLLDDIGDRLDDQRLEHLAKLLSENHFGQTFITDINSSRLKSFFITSADKGEIISI